MAIYTKQGDKGKTFLYQSKKRVFKDNIVIDALGSLDEFNSYLGVVKTKTKNKKTIKSLEDIQKQIMTINAILAGSRIKFPKDQTKTLEGQIDIIDKQIPALNQFILPGGSDLSSHLMYARGLIRKAERKVVSLSKKRKVNREIIIFINRLSDYLFVLARFENKKRKVKDKVWER